MAALPQKVLGELHRLRISEQVFGTVLQAIERRGGFYDEAWLRGHIDPGSVGYAYIPGLGVPKRHFKDGELIPRVKMLNRVHQADRCPYTVIYWWFTPNPQIHESYPIDLVGSNSERALLPLALAFDPAVIPRY